MSLEPRPPALLAFLAPIPPRGGRAATPTPPAAAASSSPSGRSAFSIDDESVERQERESSGSPHSTADSSSCGSPPPNEPPEQQHRQQQRPHRPGGTTGRGLPPARTNRQTTARANRNDHGDATPAPAAAAVSQQGEERRSEPLHPPDLRVWMFLFCAVGVIILDACSILLYAQGVASASASASASQLSTSSLFTHFVSVGAIGPATAIAIVVRVVCSCFVYLQRRHPWQLFTLSGLRRHRTAARPAWRRSLLRYLWGVGTDTAGTPGEGDAGDRVGGDIGPGGTPHSDSGDPNDAIIAVPPPTPVMGMKESPRASALAVATDRSGQETGV